MSSAGATTTAARGANLEFGIGGDLRGLESAPELGFAGYLRAIQDAARALDPLARVDFLEGCSTPENCAIALDLGMPYRQFTDFYMVGGGPGQPDALERLRQNLDRAAASGTVTALNMQVWGTRTEPSLDRLADFYHAAYALAKPYAIGVFTETHINRFTYDPRRLLAVHDRLLADSSGAYGLQVGADFSHYVHQLGNSHGSNWDDLRSGALRMDPFDPGNIISTRIIAAGLVGYGHLRCAVPNDLAPGKGSIQYPLADPAGEPGADPGRRQLRFHGAWDESRTAAWRELYRQAFAHQITHPERGIARFSTEFIEVEDEYRMDAYGNLHQNLSALCWAQRLKRELLATASKAAHAN